MIRLCAVELPSRERFRESVFEPRPQYGQQLRHVGERLSHFVEVVPALDKVERDDVALVGALRVAVVQFEGGLECALFVIGDILCVGEGAFGDRKPYLAREIERKQRQHRHCRIERLIEVFCPDLDGDPANDAVEEFGRPFTRRAVACRKARGDEPDRACVLAAFHRVQKRERKFVELFDAARQRGHRHRVAFERPEHDESAALRRHIEHAVVVPVLFARGGEEVAPVVPPFFGEVVISVDVSRARMVIDVFFQFHIHLT